MQASFKKTEGLDGARRNRQPMAATGELIHLRPGQGVSLHGARGWYVRALRGAIWLTQDGDMRDIVLEAGQSFTLDRPEAALLWPFSDSCVLVGVHDDAQQAALPRPAACAGLRPAALA